MNLTFRLRLDLTFPLVSGGRNISLLMRMSPRQLGEAARLLLHDGTPSDWKPPEKRVRFFLSPEKVDEMMERVGVERNEQAPYRVELTDGQPAVKQNFDELPSDIEERFSQSQIPHDNGVNDLPAIPATPKGTLRTMVWLLNFYKNMTEVITREQARYLDGFDPFLLNPLVMKDVATPLDVSESTVSRAVKAIGNIQYNGFEISLRSLIPGTQLSAFRAFYVLQKMEACGDLDGLSGNELADIIGGISSRAARKYMLSYKRRLDPVYSWLVMTGGIGVITT